MAVPAESAPPGAPLPLLQRVPYLLDRCRDRRVLHLGCTNWPYTDAALADGSLLHLQLAKVARELHGLDADAEGLARLQARGHAHLHQGDLEALDTLGLDAGFDVIVAGEIVEHLSNPGRFLTGVQSLMRPETTLIITTVNAYCGLRNAQYFLRGRGGRQEPVHPDHVAYYSQSTLTHLVKRAGLDVTFAAFYDVGREHRPYMPAYWRFVSDVLVGLARQTADGVIVECRLGAARSAR